MYKLKITGFTYNQNYDLNAAADEVSRLTGQSKSEALDSIRDINNGQHLEITLSNREDTKKEKENLSSKGLSVFALDSDASKST